MHVAITGGSGELGTLVLRRLVADRSIKKIVSLDVRPPIVASPKIEHHRLDVRDPSIGKFFEGCAAVIHLAAIVVGDPKKFDLKSINVGGSENVFRAAAAAKVGHVLYASSIAAYGVTEGHPNPVHEDAPRKHVPDFAYSASKFEVEAFLDRFEPAHPEMKITRFRPGILVGTRMEHPLGDALKRRTIASVSKAPMPLVWDEDVADAFILAMKKGVAGAFNVCADEAESPEELAHAVGLKLVNPPAIVVEGFAVAVPLLARAGLMRPVDPSWVSRRGIVLIPSSEKAKRELGWAPKQPTARAVLKHYLEVSTGMTDRRITAFLRLVDAGAKRMPKNPEAKGIDMRVHLQLVGNGGGDWSMHVRDGRLSVRPGVPRPPDAVITLKASLFLELVAGKTDYGAANLTGKVRVEGEPRAGMVLGGILGLFRKETEGAGVRGLAARGISAWMARA